MTRCFIALELSEDARSEIAKIQKDLEKRNLFKGKLTERENLHLTLKFLGNIDESTLEEIRKRLEQIRFKGFKSFLGGVGIFSPDFVKIIWIELLGKEVFELQKQIDEKLSNLFDKERRFMSHITIARVKEVRDKRKLLDYLNSVNIKKIEFPVSEFVFKKSELTEKCPIYTDIERYKLQE